MALELTAVNLSADSIRQRFLILQALRWLPVGFVVGALFYIDVPRRPEAGRR